ncbi:MAG: hypothetical protein J6Q89_08700 [Clostridia bacterium]|nr:hypothetical protein [Clostridia bacterium]
MKTIIENIKELLESGFGIAEIAQITGYSPDRIKQVETNWRNQVKTKGGDNGHR